MLAYHHLAAAANPELRHHLHEVNEARAAYVYATWKRSTRALGALIRRLVERIRRARRARQADRELSALSDHHLKDIGLTRGDIGAIVKAMATETRAAELTIADLRQARLVDVAASENPMAGLPRPDHRPRHLNPSAALRPAAVVAKGTDAAA